MGKEIRPRSPSTARHPNDHGFHKRGRETGKPGHRFNRPPRPPSLRGRRERGGEGEGGRDGSTPPTPQHAARPRVARLYTILGRPGSLSRQSNRGVA